MSDHDNDNAAAEARKHTKITRPTHRDTFNGSPRKLNGRKFGTRLMIAGTIYIWTRFGKKGRWVASG